MTEFDTKRDACNRVIMHFRPGAAANCELGRVPSGYAMNDNGEFDGIPAFDLVGDWLTPQIKVPD